jgi:hypothetical protein
MPADQIPTEFGRNPAMVRSRPGLAKMVGIRMDPAKNLAGFGQNDWDSAGSDWIRRSQAGILQFWPDPAKRARRNLATATGRCRIPATVVFSHFVIFFV